MRPFTNWRDWRMSQNLLQQFLNCISICAVIVMVRHRNEAYSEQHSTTNWVFCRRQVIRLIVALGPADSVGPGGAGGCSPHGGISECQSIDCLAQVPNCQPLRWLMMNFAQFHKYIIQGYAEWHIAALQRPVIGRSLSIVLQDADIAFSKRELNNGQKRDFEDIDKDCRNVLDELQRILDKNTELGSKSRSVRKRIKRV
jgi:hypothetical protein